MGHRQEDAGTQKEGSMSELKFKVGDLLADDLGTIGEILGITPESEFPYRIREVDGGTARHAQSETMRSIGHLTTEVDPVHHPTHYVSHPSGIECIQITEHMGFNLGNALKYVWRCDLKHEAIEDLEKAVWYIRREIAKRKTVTNSDSD